jgi:hypothetical protein
MDIDVEAINFGKLFTEIDIPIEHPFLTNVNLRLSFKIGGKCTIK